MVNKTSTLFLVLFVLILAQISPAQSDWTGEYFFDEDGGETVGGSKIYIAHTIKVTEKEGKLGAHIYSQGFQTSRDIFADVVVEDSGIKFLFRNTGPEHTLGSFEPGEPLLSLLRKDGELLTYWYGFKPAIDSNLADAQVRFRREDNLKKAWSGITTADSRVSVEIPSNFEKFQISGFFNVSQGNFKDSLKVAGPSIYAGSFSNNFLRLELYTLPDAKDAKTLRKVYRERASRRKTGFKKRKLNGHEVFVLLQRTPEFYRESWYLVVEERLFVFTGLNRTGSNRVIERFFDSIRIDGSGIGKDTLELDSTTAEVHLPDSSFRILQKAPPGYSTLARSNGIMGSIKARVTFGESGLVTNIKLLNSLQFGLDRQAQVAAAQILYLPEVKNGQITSVSKTIAYTFSII